MGCNSLMVRLTFCKVWAPPFENTYCCILSQLISLKLLILPNHSSLNPSNSCCLNIQKYVPPTSLPPSRACNHQIPLLPGAQPFSIHAYCYPQALKDEIEHQVQEMLAYSGPHTTQFKFLLISGIIGPQKGRILQILRRFPSGKLPHQKI